MDHGDDTNVVVNRMLQKRRRMRMPVIVGSILGLAFLAYMGVEFGAHKSSELQVDGPVAPGNPINGPTDDFKKVPGTAAHGPDAAAPGGKPARIEVVIEGKNPQLWVDGKATAVTPKMEFQMVAGKHSLKVLQGGRTLTENMTLEPNEAYQIQFAEKITVSKVH